MWCKLVPIPWKYYFFSQTKCFDNSIMESNVVIIRGDVISYNHLHFTTVCKNIMLIVSLSGRGIVVLENRHTSLCFLMHDCMWLPSQAMPHLLGKRSNVFKWVWWNISRQFKTTLCMPYLQKFSFLYIVFYFNIFILSWLIMTLEVNTPSKFDNIVQGRLKNNG